MNSGAPGAGLAQNALDDGDGDGDAGAGFSGTAALEAAPVVVWNADVGGAARSRSNT